MRVFRFIHFRFIQVFYHGPQIGCCRCRGRSRDHRYIFCICRCDIIVVVAVVAVGSAVLHICIFSCLSRLSVFNSVLCMVFFFLRMFAVFLLSLYSIRTNNNKKNGPNIFYVYIYISENISCCLLCIFKSRYSSNFILI